MFSYTELPFLLSAPISHIPSSSYSFLSMFHLAERPSTKSILSMCASVAAFVMLVQSLFYQFMPRRVQTYVLSFLNRMFHPRSSYLTLIIQDRVDGHYTNQLYDASTTYLRTKIGTPTGPSVDRLRVIKIPKEKNISLAIEPEQEIIDTFEEIQLRWKLVSSGSEKTTSDDKSKLFELSFLKKHKEKVLVSYLPYVLDRAEALKQENKAVRLYTLRGGHWSSINLNHPSTFSTLAMDPDKKMELINDLDMFVKRKELYKKVGKAWKRGYLLYGPPGTGKSSLIAAMANYLKFDVYDLELTSVRSDSSLRGLLAETKSRSIIVIEDIDCSARIKPRGGDPSKDELKEQLSLSGILNFSDGLWSSYGDERIIIFTTNHKARLDPALLRPGRMDMHIFMSYCTPSGFELLAFNYLGVKGHHPLFDEIKGLIEDVEITPAEIAEQLLKNDDADTTFRGLVQVLLQKKNQKVIGKDEAVTEVECQEDVKEK